MSEDDIDGQGTPAHVDRDRRSPRFSWTPAYEATFFRSLCESVQLGLRENSSFKPEAWERAAQALQARHAAYPTKNHLINKSDNARKRFRLWRGLREDPEFLYNPVTRTVTATEEAWRAHVEREPLSRALRGRPFDHEDYMEILYPDVIGSGGAPKRIMKPRRRTEGAPTDDAEMPGTGVLNLTQPTLASPSQQPQTLSQTPTGSSSTSIPTQQLQQATGAATSMGPSQATATASSSALTPPDETASQSQGQGQKPRQGADHPRLEEPDLSPPLDGTLAGPTTQAPTSDASSPQKRRKTSSRGASLAVGPPVLSSSALPAQLRESSSSSSLLQVPWGEEILDALKSRAAPRWREQALDVFFREFSDEDLDLQVKISENVLSNEHKAMVFCKMPDRVRQHWVGKFREMHQLNKTS